MIKRFYNIYDTVGKMYLNPLVAVNDADAIRIFTTFVNGDKETSNIAKYPHQYILFHHFDMDDQTGQIGNLNVKTNMLEKLELPRELIVGVSCVDDSNKEQKYTIQDIALMLKEVDYPDNVKSITEATN